MDGFLSSKEEQRLRELANGIVRGIQTPEEVLEHLGFTTSEYVELSETRSFRQMLRQAQDEWDGASNTHKRIKLKAAVNIEQALPHFYMAMTDAKEPLSSKVKAFEVVSRVAGLGNPEPVNTGAGQFFKLEINLGQGVAPIMLGAGVENMTIEHENQEMRVHPLGVGLASPLTDVYSQSKLFDALPLEDL
jgi:hypothetical protein